MLQEVLRFLKEDLGEGDITTESVFPGDMDVEAEVVSKGPGVIAGLEECKLLLDHLKLRNITWLKDGDKIVGGDVVLRINGSAREVLKVERTLLNLLMRMSGVATFTSELVKKVEGRGVAIAGTRKTTPGFRRFEKKAIVLGGGKAHRMGLYDGILIKDNHLAASDMQKAIKRCKEAGKGPVEVEVSSKEDCIKACEYGADIVMLDNMGPEEVGDAISALVKKGLREKVEIEVSGNITSENIEEYAKAGPDVISLGGLTTDSKWLDMSLRVTSTKKRESIRI